MSRSGYFSVGPRRCERAISTLRQHRHKSLPAMGIGAVAELPGCSENNSVSCIAVIRSRGSSVQNSEKLDHEFSKEVKNRNG
jgi:hypothetical protein